ncbi:Histone-lysine N-methyltransferase SETMAR [Eumeta japonica]|uniref:Histone-lysine N-methyltransferase SETMAR n=1 Tax=Eumeta variegata TaxID=151549 RepID=A0A4C1WG09_EUMVA|nr:Histone-lysine N-methyltransferase SETMAR [Eumeta japonica]
MLTPFDKQRRLQTTKDFELVGDNIDEICDRIVTVNETWVRQYDPESKQESMQWTKKGERPPKKFKAREAVVQKRRKKLSRGVLFLQDNASVHTARVSRQALKDTGFSEIDHQPYSPDLAPSDYFLFSNLKKELPSSHPAKPLQSLFRISFTYCPFAGALAVLLIAVPMSYLTGKAKTESINPDVFCPLTQSFLHKPQQSRSVSQSSERKCGHEAYVALDEALKQLKDVMD